MYISKGGAVYLKNVEAIKYLDNMEQGGFLTIKVPISRNQYIPVTAMFVGKDISCKMVGL